jgi:hypothetical protein
MRVVISDTDSVLTLASAFGMVTTQRAGKAVHFGMGSGNHTRDAGRLFLDWWLLRRATWAGTFDMSALLNTARWHHGDSPIRLGFPTNTSGKGHRTDSMVVPCRADAAPSSESHRESPTRAVGEGTHMGHMGLVRGAS